MKKKALNKNHYCVQEVGHCRGIIVPSRAVGLRGINLQELPQRLNVVAPTIAAYRGIQAHLNVRGTQRGKPLPNTTGESTHPDRIKKKTKQNEHKTI